MSTSWIAPAVASFVERLPTLTKKGDHRTKTHTLRFAPCDVCWEPTWLAEADIKVAWKCPSCRRTSSRQLSSEVPVCDGRTVKGERFAHEPVEMTTADPWPGRSCRMTPRCPGRHRRDGIDLRSKET